MQRSVRYHDISQHSTNFNKKSETDVANIHCNNEDTDSVTNGGDNSQLCCLHTSNVEFLCVIIQLTSRAQYYILKKPANEPVPPTCITHS